jgi:hypothetical protein
MAEIKSTLDIIMEKTRGMTLTDEEKRKFKEDEIAKEVKGLIQRFVDGFLELEKVQEEIAKVPMDRREPFLAALRQELLERIDPETDNEPVLGLMEKSLGIDVSPLRRKIITFKDHVEAERRRKESAYVEDLRGQGISGSAVVPNIQADPGWAAYVAQEKERFRAEVVNRR